MASRSRNRSKSSRRWLAEHESDLWVKRAREAGWRSRAVFKLEEIDSKAKLIRPGMRIVDLGAAPGGWSQYATRKLDGRGTIVATDILPMDALEEVTFIQGDFTEQLTLDAVRAALEGPYGSGGADLVMSDMAPNLSGVDAVDQPRAMYLAELALDLAQQVLVPSGAFLTKVFHGEGFDGYLEAVKASFGRVQARKPKASRPRSRETYLLARDLRASR